MDKGNDAPTGAVRDMTPQDYLAQVQATYPQLKQNLAMKSFLNQDGLEKMLTTDDLDSKKKSVLHFNNCKNCKFSVARNVETVKLHIEKCENSVFNLSGVIKTGTVEAWRCKNLTIVVDTEIGTLQLDLSENVTVVYAHRVYLGSIVQAGVQPLHVQFNDHAEMNFISGVDELRKGNPELDEKFDQYITRFVDGKLVTELVVRYKDGMYSTEREMARDEAEREGTEELTKEKLRNMIRVAGPAIGLKEEDLVKRSQQGREAETARQEAENAANLKKHAGNKAFTAGDFARAVALYGEAIALTPENPVLYSNRAQAHLELKELSLALADADKCITLRAEFPKGHFRRGLVLKAMGKLDEARRALTEAHNLAPRDEEIEKELQALPPAPSAPETKA